LLNELSRKSIALEIKKEVDMPNGAGVGKTYLSPRVKVFGQVNDGDGGMCRVEVELFDAAGGRVAATQTNPEGFYEFDIDHAGNFEVHFPKQIPNPAGKAWELPDEKEKPLAVALAAGEVKLLDAVSYQREQFIIEKPVLVGGRRADGILVDVRRPKERVALQSARTKDGSVRFVMDDGGDYEVRVYTKQNEFGDPLIEFVKL
jgi:hypothetical protein